MPNKESLRMIVSKDKSIKALCLDPRSMPYSGIKEMVDLKARNIEDTTIYMEYRYYSVFVNSAKLHKVNRMPQQEKRKAIQQITNNIANADIVLIYSQVT